MPSCVCAALIGVNSLQTCFVCSTVLFLHRQLQRRRLKFYLRLARGLGWPRQPAGQQTYGGPLSFLLGLAPLVIQHNRPIVVRVSHVLEQHAPLRAYGILTSIKAQ
jgi:hypothetical protein